MRGGRAKPSHALDNDPSFHNTQRLLKPDCPVKRALWGVASLWVPLTQQHMNHRVFNNLAADAPKDTRSTAVRPSFCSGHAFGSASPLSRGIEHPYRQDQRQEPLP